MPYLPSGTLGTFDLRDLATSAGHPSKCLAWDPRVQYVREQIEKQINGDFVAVLQLFREQMEMSYQMRLFSTLSLQFVREEIEI